MTPLRRIAPTIHLLNDHSLSLPSPCTLCLTVVHAQARDNRTIKPVTLPPTLETTQGIVLPFLSLPLSKYYPISRFDKRSKTNTVKKSCPERATNKSKPIITNKAIPTTEARNLAHLSQQTPTIKQKVDQSIADYSKKFYSKGKLTASAPGSLSLSHIMTDDAVFEHVCLHLVLSEFLSPHEIENLNAYNVLFHHFHTMLHFKQLDIICKLFQCPQRTQTKVSIHFHHSPHAHAINNPIANRKLHCRM